MKEKQVQSLSWEDPLEKEMATLFSSLAWETPWTVWGHKESDTTERLNRKNTDMEKSTRFGLQVDTSLWDVIL